MKNLPDGFWERPIAAETLNWYAYTNALTTSNPKGIVLEFHGLGSDPPIDPPEPPSQLMSLCTGHDILYIAPHYGPWNWMNDVGVAITDEIIAAALDRFKLPTNVPVVSTGGSMGGLSALVYTCYARHNVVACAANCPVCDLVFHCGERPDLPRTIYNAFKHYPGAFIDAVCSASPLHLAGEMPFVPYYLVHGEADGAVCLEVHSQKLVGALREKGRSVTLESVPGMEHCALAGAPYERYHAFILAQFG